MKKYLMLIIAITMVMGFSLPVMAEDYSAYSTEDLAAMRGTRVHATAEERQAFRDEWQRRINSMTVDERRQYSGRPANAYGQGDGQGYGYGSQNHMRSQKRNGQCAGGRYGIR